MKYPIASTIKKNSRRWKSNQKSINSSCVWRVIWQLSDSSEMSISKNPQLISRIERKTDRSKRSLWRIRRENEKLVSPWRTDGRSRQRPSHRSRQSASRLPSTHIPTVTCRIFRFHSKCRRRLSRCRSEGRLMRVRRIQRTSAIQLWRRSRWHVLQTAEWN